MLEQLEIMPDGDVKPRQLKYSMKRIIQSIAALLAVLFFFPLCTVSCSGQTINVNGVSSTIGVEIYGEREGGNFLCIMLLILPVCIFSVFLVKQIGELKKQYLYASALAAGDLVFLIIYLFGVLRRADEYMAEAKFTFAYYLSVLGSLAICAAAFLAAANLQEMSGGSSLLQSFSDSAGRLAENPILKRVGSSTDKAEESYPKICYKCGNILKKDMNFCPKCGTPYKDPVKK